METSFNKLEINSKLIDGLKKQGIIKPTEIQCESIPFALQNLDVVGQSQTGSGKTLAYLLPLFQKINTEKKEMQAFILAPTHELVMQIDKQIRMLSENSNVPVTSVSIIGEVNITRQIEKLKLKPNIIVGSAGRILELIKRKKINSQTVKTIVIDEADMLLDKNNYDTVKDVIKTTMKDRQLMAFSATLNERALNIAMELMKDPKVVRIEEKNLVNPNIKHMYFIAEQREKIEVLRKLIASINPEKAIIFINKSDDIEITTLKLQYHKLKALAIYGKSQKEDRQKAIQSFRDGKIQLLVASDIAARGLDIQNVTHIFNLDLPEESKGYLHRVGRTGREEKEGTAISIVTKKETALIKMYEKDYNIKIQKKEIYKGQIIDPYIRRA